MGLDGIGKLLLMVGGGIALLGLVFLLIGRAPFLGRLPGDISIERDSFSFHLPIVTMIVISIVLTVILNIIFRILR
ncbi:MAG: DUF2905 domain-containing protein [Chloroflexi bacterium]|nr:DUF2905 domain-containing protein [Chloroflexota bacterium]